MRTKTTRIAAMLGACAMAVAACTQQQGGAAASTETTDDGYQMTAEDLAKYVEVIYGDVNRDFGGEIQMDLDSAYCSERWNTKLAELHKRQRENPDTPIDFFSANYWVMGQDAMNVKATNVDVEELGADKATVSFDLSNFGSATRVMLHMVKEGDDWKIDNFIDKTNDIDWGAIMNE